MRYFDTSVVFSLYVNEARSPRVDAELRTPASAGAVEELGNHYRVARKQGDRYRQALSVHPNADHRMTPPVGLKFNASGPP